MSSSRLVRLVLVGLLLVVAGWFGWNAWSGGTTQDSGMASGAGSSGGRLKATYQTEPTNFLRLVAPTAANQMVSLLTQSTLLRLNAAGELEPRLAASWSPSEDGLTWTMTLRPGAKFSDGSPVTTADVAFSVRAALADKAGSSAAGDLRVGGQPLTVQPLDDRRFTVTFPSPHGAGIAILESLPILPRHKLEAALDAGNLGGAWVPSVAPSEVVGAGPFMLKDYVPGQRLVFDRNPHFYGEDEAGVALPYLDGIDMTIVPEYNTELLRLQAGETDVITERLLAADLAVMRQSEAAGTVQLTDAGPALDVWTLWFNLKPGAKSAEGRPWLVAPEFRRAISHAINRQAIVDTVYLGQASPVYGPITPSHGPWYVPTLPITEFDQGRARTLLTSIGLTDRDGDGVLDDESGRPVRFSIITRSGQPDREKTITMVQEQLRQVGIAVDPVTLANTEVQTRYAAGDFDAIYYGARQTTREPAAGFWRSAGPFHFWNPGQQKPATPWEERIDMLFQQQAATMDPAERQRIFAEAQQILAEQLPALWLVAPRVIVPVSHRVRGATPIVLLPPVLWNAERLSLVDGGR